MLITKSFVLFFVCKPHFAVVICCGMAARAYLLGYNCADEKELEATWRFL